MRHRTLARLTLLLALCLVLPLAAQGRQHAASQLTTSSDAANAGSGRGDDWNLPPSQPPGRPAD